MLSQNNELLEKSFDIFNKVYFDSKLPNAVITIQSSPKCYGYITVKKVWKNEEESYHEINISAEHLTRPIEQVMATLMHEMVHLYCICNGIQDTSKGGRYHNKNFKREAELRDLQIDYIKYIGYSATTPTEKLIKTIREYELDKPIEYCRSERMLSIGGTGNDGTDGSGTDETGCICCRFLYNAFVSRVAFLSLSP